MILHVLKLIITVSSSRVAPLFPWVILLFALHHFTPDTLSAGDLPTQSPQQQTLDEKYDQAQFYFNQLLTSEELGGDRSNWLKSTRHFRQIYLLGPKSDQAAPCLFMLGKVYHKMYQRFQLPADLQDSITYFNDTARLFSASSLADDAHFLSGSLYLNEHNNPQKAALYFTKIIEQYPNGDKYDQAGEILKQLSHDHDIPLPDEMVGGKDLNDLNYVKPVKYWSSDDYTRVVIMASGPVKYREELLEKTDHKPRRLYIDFHESYIEPQYRAPVPIEDGLLRRIRTGQFSKDTVRVVLDIESIDSYKIYSLPDPFRVVIDVRGGQNTSSSDSAIAITDDPHSSEDQTASSEQDNVVILRDYKKIAKRRKGKDTYQPEQAETKGVLTLAQQLGLGVKRIVLDPGHGGKDPGAISNGLKEKDIVLKLAKELKPVLESELGCEVILTRSSDRFLSLEERTAIANTQGADLFLSLHINAHPSPDVRGFETYYLNLTTNAEAMRVAAMENATSTHQMSELQDILSDILKNSKINESSRLAEQVHNAVIDGLPDQFGPIRNLGVKQAPFYVLIGAQMPAILIEVAFISNKQDAKNLKSPAFMDALVAEIIRGIRNYVSDTTVSLSPQLR